MRRFVVRTRVQNGPRISNCQCAALLRVLAVAGFVGFSSTTEASGKGDARAPVFTSKNVHASRSVPEFTPGSLVQPLPDDPSDDDIARLHLFPQRIVPVEPLSSHSLAKTLFAVKKPTAIKESNVEVAETLKAARQSTVPLETTQLELFLKAHPQSRWAPSLRHELARRQFKRGFFSQAVAGWDALWDELKERHDAGAVEVANVVLSQLLDTYIGLGKADRLTALIGDQESRPGNPVIQAKAMRAKQAIWLLKHKGAQNVMCGPVALYCILRHNHQTFVPVRLNDITDDYIATGISLSQIKQYSDTYHLGMAMARKSPGQPIPTPAVMHLANGHYSAITAETNGNYFLEDRPMQFQGWVSLEALEAQASGYFLIPARSFSDGWRSVSEPEGSRITGRDGLHGQEDFSQSNTSNSTTTGDDNNSCGMPVYTFFPQIASLRLRDTPVGYRPPVGPAVFPQIAYNDLDDSKPVGPPTFSNVGRIWSINWVAYIDYVAPPFVQNTVLTVHIPGGGTEIYFFDNTTGLFGPNDRSFATVSASGSSTFTRTLPDGSQEVYNAPDNASAPNEIFLTQSIDPYGNALSFTYDSNMRLVAVTDAIGQVTALEHKWPGDMWKVTKITDPFGRFATFSYNGSSNELSSVTDVIGLTSSFVYDTNEFPISMVTPYGTTTFANTRAVTPLTSYDYSLTVTDPEGNQEKVQYIEPIDVPPLGPPLPTIINVGGTNVSFIAEDARLAFRNSFYWNKLAMKQGPNDFTAARNYRWLTDQFYLITPILEATKEALENRVWFNYPGQVGGPEYTAYPYYSGQGGQPIKTMRMLSDGTPQLIQTYYNSLGHYTTFVDPVGRTTLYNYASNQIDLLEVRQKTGPASSDRLALLTYNSQHLPLTMVDAAGQTYRATYNAQGQPLTLSDPLGETTTLSYDTNGYLLSIDGALPGTNDVIRFSYDGFGRMRTTTDTEGYTRAFEYDALDRLTRRTYPDGTYEQYVYDRLDLAATCDRLGRWTTNTFNAIRKIVQTRDPLGRTTTYDWCLCGAPSALTDPLGRTTTWRHDLQGRPVTQQYPDGSTISYTYENTTGRLKSTLDEKGQETLWDYYPDNNVMQVSYPNAAIPTPTVRYQYDPNYNRLLTLRDGFGTTTYSYNPITAPPSLGAGKPASVEGPLPNSAAVYQYDQLGRVVQRAINGVPLATTYDALGRPVTVTDALGTFQYAYVGATSRLASEAYPNGQTDLYSYYHNPGDARLQQIQHLKPNGSLLSGCGYAYDPVGNITVWSNQWDTLPTRVWRLTYDAAGQLTDVAGAGGPSSPTNYSYSYDAVGNRLSAAANGLVSRFSYNALNQLVGSTAEPPISPVYEWDAANRLTAIQRGTNRSEFSYDGWGRRIRIVEKSNGVGLGTNCLLWCGTEICEVRDATGGNVLRRLYPQGEQLVAGNGVADYFYTRDHLGSIREALDSNGVLATRYDYDPYGRQIVVQQNLQTVFAFTGHFFHAPSSLYLALYRPLDSVSGRWLSRDPLRWAEFLVDPNLYAYVRNDPIDLKDPSGLVPSWTQSFWAGLFKICAEAFGMNPAVPTTPPTPPPIPVQVPESPEPVGPPGPPQVFWPPIMPGWDSSLQRLLGSSGPGGPTS